MNQEGGDNLDFSLYGPSKTSNGKPKTSHRLRVVCNKSIIFLHIFFFYLSELMSIQQQRAEYYATVNSQNANSNGNETAPAPADPETPYHPPNDTAAQRNNYKLVCYYSIPSGSNINASTDLLPEMINATLCTHINIAFAGIANNNISPLNPEDEKVIFKKLEIFCRTL